MSKFNRQPQAAKEEAPPFKKREMIATDVDQELVIDTNHLNEELMDQPLYFKKWTGLLAEVNKKCKIINLTLEEKEAELHIKYANDGTAKKVKEIESAVTSDPEIQKLKRELIDVEELVSRFEGIVKAFYQRHEMLKDLSANKRKELVD